MVGQKVSRRNLIRWSVVLGVVGILALGANQGIAATCRTTATGNWTDGNWTNGTPSTSQGALIGSTSDAAAATTAQVTLNSSVPGALNIIVGRGSANGDAHGTLDVMNGGSAVADYKIAVGRGTSGSTGTLNVSGGTLSSRWEGLVVGWEGSTGTVNLSGGTIQSCSDTTKWIGQTLIGESGTGSVYQTGGDFRSSGTVHIGMQTAGSGLYDLQDGTLTMTCAAVNPSGEEWYTDYQGIRVGDQGDGTLLLNYTASILEANGVKKYLSVRETADATGLLHGSGLIGLTYYLQNSGKVVADGYGTTNGLNLTSFESVTNAIENDADNGWYAQNSGKLRLPGVSVAAGDSSYNWGESQDDTSIDLVNSLTVDFANLGSAGTLTATLLALDRSDVAAAPAGVTFVSCHNLSLSGATYDSFDLTMRYDDAAAAGSEGQLGLYHWNGSSWDALGTTVDQANNLVTATGVTGMSDFAVGYVPEPATLVVIGLGACLSLCRRCN